MTQLADALGISRSSCTELVAKMVRTGYLRRKVSEHDRKVFIVDMPPRFRPLAAGVHRAYERILAQALRQLASPEERIAFLKGLLIMIEFTQTENTKRAVQKATAQIKRRQEQILEAANQRTAAQLARLGVDLRTATGTK